MKTLEILIPQYKETDDILKPMLDSIAIQQSIDLNDVGVIICNDGSDVKLSEEFLKSYPFDIAYYQEPHRGVSGTRNACFEHSTADYVMFCDADDMFCHVCGLHIIFQEIANGGFDTIVSNFMEETQDPILKQRTYINREMDSTFVHGKIHRRQYLLDNNIRWNESLTIHEDSYFNILCQKLTNRAKYCPFPFYLWKWRDESVCRHDPKYILKTYTNMLASNEALVEEFVKRGRIDLAAFYVNFMVYDAYFTLNKKEWIEQENQEYRQKVEKTFKTYYKSHKDLYNMVKDVERVQLVQGLRNRMYQEGLLMEVITFDDWIKQIEEVD